MKRKQSKIIAFVVIGIILVLGLLFGEGLYGHFHKYTFPGPLSAVQAAEPIATETNQKGGFSSHAEFEQECGHCHAPLHCVTDTKCQDCHMEIAEQRGTTTGLHSRLPGVNECQTCHTEHQGREASITEFAFHNIDHELLSGFSLANHQWDYENNNMSCKSCHSKGRYGDEALDCLTCHINENHDQTAEHMDLYGSDCVPCHDGNARWADFDHDQVYLLDGEHENTDCAACHIDQVFTGTPQDCVSCHNDSKMYGEIFGDKCERCHSTTAWLPAQLTVHTFLVDHGEEIGSSTLTCETCHEKTYTEYPCYSCHDVQEMQDYHLDIDIDAYENCIDCHPTGREGEADAFMEMDSGL